AVAVDIRIAGVAEPVAVQVVLRRVGDRGAVVAGVADIVAVAVRLVGVGFVGAVVAGVAHGVAVGVRADRGVVARPAHLIARPGRVAGVRRRTAHDRHRPGAGAALAGVRLGASVPVVASRAVGLVRIAARAIGRVARAGVVALVE